MTLKNICQVSSLVPFVETPPLLWLKWQRPIYIILFGLYAPRSSVATNRYVTYSVTSFNQSYILAEKHVHEPPRPTCMVVLWFISYIHNDVVKWPTIRVRYLLPDYYSLLPIEFPLGEAMYSLFKLDTNVCLLLGVILLFLTGVAYLYSQTYKVKLGCNWKNLLFQCLTSLPSLASTYSLSWE